ncbi:MAG: GSCFA domain-containing protein [Alphaproteobacteria bacterium]|nr:GSCFA domain-containing protein [Alphaproteobacteria bacterium]
MADVVHPYRDLPDFCFWSRAMTWPAPGHIDPVTTAPQVRDDELIATIGSCFAQHLARHLKARGLKYFVSENAPDGLSEAKAHRRNYGIFSARYGNVYTVRQAVQLLDRAFGRFTPEEIAWPRDGGFVDPFRPQIEPEPFSSVAHVMRSALDHLAHVREVFTRCDWLVFTLGLTEAWRAKSDGAVYPLAPGVAGGTFDPDRYEFVNFGIDEVRADLALFVDRLASVNKKARVLLTVSPVPLIATYEQRHVWVSTTYSKAVLRIAADEIERRYSNVFYFPSYEIITSPAAGGRYYRDDLREVTEIGVRHVMRVFEAHYLQELHSGKLSFEEQLENDPVSSENGRAAPAIVCDEEVIQKALRESGFAASHHQS